MENGGKTPIKFSDKVELISTGAAKNGHPKGHKFSRHPLMAKELVKEGKATYAKDSKESDDNSSSKRK